MHLVWPWLAAGVESAGRCPEGASASQLLVLRAEAPGQGASDPQVPLPRGSSESGELSLVRSLGGGSQGTGWHLGQAMVL